MARRRDPTEAARIRQAHRYAPLRRRLRAIGRLAGFAKARRPLEARAPGAAVVVLRVALERHRAGLELPFDAARLVRDLDGAADEDGRDGVEPPADLDLMSPADTTAWIERSDGTLPWIEALPDVLETVWKEGRKRTTFLRVVENGVAYVAPGFEGTAPRHLPHLVRSRLAGLGFRPRLRDIEKAIADVHSLREEIEEDVRDIGMSNMPQWNPGRAEEYVRLVVAARGGRRPIREAVIRGVLIDLGLTP